MSATHVYCDHAVRAQKREHVIPGPKEGVLSRGETHSKTDRQMMRAQRACHQEEARMAFGLSLEEGAEYAQWAGNAGGRALLAKASLLVQCHLPFWGIHKDWAWLWLLLLWPVPRNIVSRWTKDCRHI